MIPYIAAALTIVLGAALLLALGALNEAVGELRQQVANLRNVVSTLAVVVEEGLPASIAQVSEEAEQHGYERACEADDVDRQGSER